MWLTLVCVPAAAICGLLPAPGHAQTASDGPTAEQAIERQKQAYGPPVPRARCGVPDGSGDIVVCAPDDKPFRVQSSSELDPEGRAGTFDGVPRAPRLDRGSCKGQPGCVAVGRVPPPIYYIDMEAIPEPPEGSDADLIAKGLKPAP